MPRRVEVGGIASAGAPALSSVWRERRRVWDIKAMLLEFPPTALMGEERTRYVLEVIFSLKTYAHCAFGMIPLGINILKIFTEPSWVTQLFIERPPDMPSLWVRFPGRAQKINQ